MSGLPILETHLQNQFISNAVGNGRNYVTKKGKRFYYKVLYESDALVFPFIHVWLLHIVCFCILFQILVSVPCAVRTAYQKLYEG